MKNYSLLFAVMLLFCLNLNSQVNLNQGLVAFYPFEGNANDLSTNALNGTASWVTYSTGVYGAPNSSAVFNGGDSCQVDCGIDNRGITDTLAISVFIRTTFAGIGDIVSKYDPGSDAGYRLQLNLGKIKLEGRDGSGALRTTGLSTTLINDSLWHHVLAYVQGNTWLIYIDCNLEGAQSNATVNPDISSNANLGIGQDVFTNSKYLDCEVDEVRLYNRLLTQDERDSLCATAVFAGIDYHPKNEIELEIYPNPANTQITLSTRANLENAQIEIYDLMGKLVLSVTASSSAVNIDISELNKGNYIIKLRQEEQIVTKRFVKI